jgi:NitT/TauT family transport system substrate-binding protein
MFAALKTLCLGLLLAAIPNAQAQTAAPEPTPSKRLVVVVDGIAALRNFPVLVAERLGYLDGSDYRVTVMDIRPEVGIDEMVADGRADAGIAYWHHTVAMQAAGKPMAAVVTMGVTPGAKLMVANRLAGKIHSPASLSGLRIVAGGPYSAKTTVANAAVMAGGHGPADYVRLAPEDKQSIAALLRDGKADLVVARTPDGSFYEEQGVATLFADLTTVESTRRTLGALFPTTAVYMTQARIDADPGAAQHLATAFVKTLAYIRSHSAEEVAALIPEQIVGPDRAAYVRALAESMAMYQNNGLMPTGAAEFELKVLQAAVPAYASVRPEQTYTNAFAARALQGAGQ